jgi:pentatricopeptide repeat protein
MQDNEVWPNRVSYNALIEALREAGEYKKADEWYLDAVTVGVLSPFKDLARHGWVDLHMHSVNMARSAVQMTFSTLRALHTQDAVPNEGEIVFIVGKGRKLLQAINQHLAEAFDPPIRCHVHSSNLGRLLLNKQDVMHHMNQQQVTLLTRSTSVD